MTIGELHGESSESMVLSGKVQNVSVVGHRNPDTDSICSAICYANLKNIIDPDMTYTAFRAGRVSEETSFVLQRFGVATPELLKDVRTRIEDIDIRRLPGVSKDMSLKEAWTLMRENSIVSLPITEGDILQGVITLSDLGTVYLDNNSPTLLADADTSFSNITKVLKGTVAVSGTATNVLGRVVVAAAGLDTFSNYNRKNDVVIIANREKLQRISIEKGAGALIITMGEQISDEIRALAEEYGCTVIMTEFDTYAAARLINQSIPLSYAMTSKDIFTFSLNDTLSDVKKTMARKRTRDYPVLDEEGHYVGMISRRFIIDASRKKVILVDHNEKTQAVSGIDDATVMEIIDHHRLGAIETVEPVYFRNQPLGSTSTIIYQMYRENDVEIEPTYAGLLCAGIISDTLILRSPTTLREDRLAAAALAKIAGIDLSEFGAELFRASVFTGENDPISLIFRDFKTYNVNAITFGIGQVNFMDREALDAKKHELIPALETAAHEKGLKMIFVMLTDIGVSNSDVIFYGDDAADLLENAFEKTPEDSSLFIEGLVSRKKQLVPEILSEMQN
jgi:manganese-dependent inorganic pyrophosphatase